jgi:predicted membrane protein
MNTTRRMVWGMILIAIGALMLVDRLHLFDFGELVRTYWPLVLVGLGVWVLTGRQRSRQDRTTEIPGIAGRVATTATSDRISESVIFGEVVTKVQCKTFQGGKASAVFGHCLVDLSGAALAMGDHLLEVDCTFGKVEVIVPGTTTVKSTASGILGSVVVNGEKVDGFFPHKEWASPGFATSSSRLRIEGSVALGEVVISQIGA